MKQICIHHTAVKRGNSQLNAVDRYHKNKWGMKSTCGWYVGYNFFCDVDGTITQTRALDEETIANKGHNCDAPERCDTISFCFAGDFNKELPTEKQVQSFLNWRKTPEHNLPIVGHRDLQLNRTCPGVLLTDEYIKVTFLETTSVPDPEDKEKEKIADLIRQLDIIRALIRKLMNLL